VKRVYVLDASAWAKRYKEEKGSEWIDNLFMQAEKGEIDLCLLPISYYEVYWVVQKAIHTLKNRSSSERPQMRSFASPEQIALLEQKIKEDWDLRQEISKLAPEPIANWSLDSIDRNVLSVMKRYPIGPNDALILNSSTRIATGLGMNRIANCFLSAPIHNSMRLLVNSSVIGM
jgi:predicted nucleic acid-binding protein